MIWFFFFFFKQKTAYEIRKGDWSSDVCSSDLPRISRFVGRHAELGRLTTAAGETRVFVIRGVAGIGKSYLAAKACDDLRGTRSLFWHRVRPWDTRQSILAAIAEFLAAAGRPGLRSVL